MASAVVSNSTVTVSPLASLPATSFSTVLVGSSLQPHALSKISQRAKEPKNHVRSGFAVACGRRHEAFVHSCSEDAGAIQGCRLQLAVNQRGMSQLNTSSGS
jgi:hypothetical protein